MKRILLTLLLLTVTTQVIAKQGQVSRVIDGDTVVLADSTHVRLYGIDAPESKMAYGPESKSFMVSMVLGQIVDVESKGLDRYGRTIGIITMGDTNINEAMVQAGYAWVYTQYCHDPICKKMMIDEGDAREGKVGLWSDPSPQKPWEWRRAHK